MSYEVPQSFTDTEMCLSGKTKMTCSLKNANLVTLTIYKSQGQDLRNELAYSSYHVRHNKNILAGA